MANQSPNGKLFLFAIGGTGSRVLKSLVMLFAAGVTINAKQVIPVIIDLDRNNGNLSETLEAIELYKQIQRTAKTNQGNGFFKTTIGLPEGLNTHTLNLHRTIKGEDNENESLKDFIDYDKMNTSDSRHLVDLLYSKKSLNDDLSVGFKGQPHIGAVTFYNVTNLQGFAALCSNIKKDDRVFFISSIFGGTGASGFPTLLKILRDKNNKLQNQNYRTTIPVGALLILPYFKVEDKITGAKIDSDVFMTKTKVALSYYDEYVKGYNALYYLCEPDLSRVYNNSVGSKEQRNKAHFIELFGALSIIHFMDIDSKDLKKPEYFEYAINETTDAITFDNLSAGDELGQVDFRSAITRLAYIHKYFNPKDKKGRSKNFYQNQKWFKEHFNRFFTNNGFYSNTIQRFLNSYFNWLKEMGEGDIKFKPLELDCVDENIGKFVIGKEREDQRILYFKRVNPIDFNNFNTRLNSLVENTKGSNQAEHFFKLFDQASRLLIEKEVFDIKNPL